MICENGTTAKTIGYATVLQFGKVFRVLSFFGFYRAMHFSAKRSIEIAYRLSVCLSVTIRYHDHIGWNSSKIISRPNSLGPM